MEDPVQRPMASAASSSAFSFCLVSRLRSLRSISSWRRRRGGGVDSGCQLAGRGAQNHQRRQRRGGTRLHGLPTRPGRRTSSRSTMSVCSFSSSSASFSSSTSSCSRARGQEGRRGSVSRAASASTAPPRAAVALCNPGCSSQRQPRSTHRAPTTSAHPPSPPAQPAAPPAPGCGPWCAAAPCAAPPPPAGGARVSRASGERARGWARARKAGRVGSSSTHTPSHV